MPGAATAERHAFAKEPAHPGHAVPTRHRPAVVPNWRKLPSMRLLLNPVPSAAARIHYRQGASVRLRRKPRGLSLVRADERGALDIEDVARLPQALALVAPRLLEPTKRQHQVG